MNDDETLLVPESYPRKYVGSIVSFYLKRKTGVTLEKGEVVAQRWLGVTKRGAIPEYEVTILGASGRSVLARVTRDHVMAI